MSKFVFQLEGVLRHRKSLEKQRQRDVALVAAKMQALDSRLRALDAEVQQTTGQVRENHLTGRLDMHFLAAHRRYLAGTQRKALEIAQEMAGVQIELDEARKALFEAAKQRKILEVLRDKHYQGWLADLNRREFNLQDDLYTQMNHWRSAERDELGELHEAEEVTDAEGDSSHPAARAEEPTPTPGVPA